MKKILFATPYKSSTGGISQWASHIVNHYEMDGFDDCFLDVLSMNDVKQGRSTIGMSFCHRVIYGLQTYSYVVSQLKKRLKTTRYDILHISSSASLSLVKDLWMIGVARRRRVKTIVHFHFGRIPQLLESKGWEYCLLKMVIRKADLVVVMDEASYKALKINGFSNVCLIPNPLSQQVVKSVEQLGNVTRKTRTITFVGHVVPNKGIFELVEACREIDDVEVRIVGPVAPNIQTALEKIAAKRNNMVKFVGTLPLEDVIKEMKTCGVFALPTYSEGFPNVIIESMACGCSIITTPVGAIPEMLDIAGDAPCGVCVEPRNVGQLRQAICEMLDNPNQNKEYGERAKKRVYSEYSMDVVWQRLVKAWNSI